jgi:pilus assembly protein CpaF
VGTNLRPPTSAGKGSANSVGRPTDRNFELKSLIHKKLLGVLNLERVSSLPKDRLRAEIGRVVERLLEDERVPMTAAEQNRIIEEVLDEVLGLGPLEPLLKEPSISDILVNRFDKVYIERGGKLSEVPVRFRDNAHLLHIIEKIVSQVGRRIDAVSAFAVSAATSSPKMKCCSTKRPCPPCSDFSPPACRPRLRS